MNVTTIISIIFYSLLCTYLLVVLVFFIIKKIQLHKVTKKAVKKVDEDLNKKTGMI